MQQDLALATLIGATHVERNGHHYVDGMAGPRTGNSYDSLPHTLISISVPTGAFG